MSTGDTTREDFEQYIDAFTLLLNTRMKKKYRLNNHKPLISEMGDLELQHKFEEECEETLTEASWAALGRQNEHFMKPSDDLEDESGDLNNYLCEIWRRAGALEKVGEKS